jgi:putative FmdB family regulatory protein
MPTYAYKCESCGHGFEQFQSITAKPIRKCPVCGKTTAKRLVGAGSGILFKGSGFYQTDYRSDTYKKAAEGDKGTPSKKETDSSSTSSSTTKPTPDTKAKSLKKSASSSTTSPAV